MLSTVILFSTGVLGIYWATQAQNRFTRLCSLLLAFATIMLVVPYAQIKNYVPYLVAFASFLAGFEPGSSRRLNQQQKFFFAASGILFAAVAIDRVLIWPVDIQFWPLLIIYSAFLYIILRKSIKRLKTRLGALTVWLGLGIDHIVRLL